MITVFTIVLIEVEMYVCVCFAITDQQIERVLDTGAGSVEEVTRACRAGGDCGACRGYIEGMIEDRAELCPSGLVRRREQAA